MRVRYVNPATTSFVAASRTPTLTFNGDSDFGLDCTYNIQIDTASTFDSQPAIDIGSAAIAGDNSLSVLTYTLLNVASVASASGFITTLQVRFTSDATNVKVGTFYGSGTSWTNRDEANLGNIASGSLITFTGLRIAVVAGDLIGIHGDGGLITTNTTGGSGVLYLAGDHFDDGAQTYSTSGVASWKLSLEGTATVTALLDKISSANAGFSGSPDSTDPFTSGQDVTYTVQASATIDSYSESNSDTTQELISGSQTGQGQTFTGNGSKLGFAKFYLNKKGTPTGNVNAKIYAITGTSGTNGAPTGAALATSDNLDPTTLSTSLALATFSFSGANQITLTNATNYAVVVEYTSGDSSNNVGIGYDSSAPSDDGNYCALSGGSWSGLNFLDTSFYVLDNAELIIGGTYYWRVRCKDSRGIYGPWSTDVLVRPSVAWLKR